MPSKPSVSSALAAQLTRTTDAIYNDVATQFPELQVSSGQRADGACVPPTPADFAEKIYLRLGELKTATAEIGSSLAHLEAQVVEVKTEVGKLSESARRQGERLAVVEEQNRTGKEAREKIALQAESAHQAVLASVISFKTEDKKSHDALEVRLQAIERAGTVTSTRQVMFLGIAGAVAGVIGGVVVKLLGV
jgi:septal ring factor EnvC (AmiA/AmiB activator)